MTFDARSGINPAVYLVLAQVITTMGKGTFRSIAEFVTRLDIFPGGVAVGTERLVVTGVAGLAGRSGIEPMLAHEIRSAMVEGTP